ncbi:hypothetical protein SNK04_014041 [Fusarium graminearum]
MAAVNKSLRADVKATSTSVQISRDTADAVDLDTHETRERTVKAVEAINATAAYSDPDSTAHVLRMAREAHDRALRAACRCSERAIALRPPAPPNVAEWKPWAAAYVGAVGAYEDSENKRAHTAECLDEHRQK